MFVLSLWTEWQKFVNKMLSWGQFFFVLQTLYKIYVDFGLRLWYRISKVSIMYFFYFIYQNKILNQKVLLLTLLLYFLLSYWTVHTKNKHKQQQKVGGFLLCVDCRAFQNKIQNFKLYRNILQINFFLRDRPPSKVLCVNLFLIFIWSYIFLFS